MEAVTQAETHQDRTVKEEEVVVATALYSPQVSVALVRHPGLEGTRE